MTWSLWLDILLILLILLFSPIGFMRGPVKELFVTLGVVFGALMVTFWAVPWGGDLNQYANLGDDSSAFIVAMAFLALTTFIGGYGLGTALAPTTFSTEARVLGGLIAALNGALLISFTLQYVRLYLLSDENEQSLNESYVVRLLLDHVGWLLFIAALMLVPVLFYILVTGRRAYEGHVYYDDEFQDEYGYFYEDEFVPAAEQPTRYETQPAAYRQYEPSAQTRTYPPRIPGPPEESQSRLYKAEPQQPSAQPTEATRPYGGGEQRVTSEPEQSREVAGQGDTDPEMAVYSPEAVESEPRDQEATEAAGAGQTDDLPPGYMRCSNCHSVLPPDTERCPVCGTVTG